MEDFFSAALSDADTAFAEVQSNRQDELLDKPNVQGVGIGNKVTDGVETGDRAIVVFVNSKVPSTLLSSEDRVPRSLNRLKTDVVEIGDIFAEAHRADLGAEGGETGTLGEAGSLSLTQRSRPAMGGYSVGHYQITAGTAGTGAYDLAPFPGEPPRYYILSNNHVLAKSNDANIGDPVLQPGPFDGGTIQNDTIGSLYRYVPIKFDGSCNYVDAAVAVTRFEWFTREVYYIGYTTSLYKQASVGQILKKTGRTTDFTTGRVTAINSTVNVNYGGGNVAKFCGQIVTSDMSAPGDSGSLVLDEHNEPVGLLFAGSPASTILNPIAWVQGLLRVRIWP